MHLSVQYVHLTCDDWPAPSRVLPASVGRRERSESPVMDLTAPVPRLIPQWGPTGAERDG